MNGQMKFFCKTTLFKALALWADAFYKSKCPSVCPCVCLSVCSILRYRLNVFLPPLPKVGCPIFLEIQNPWGKVMDRSGLRLEHFCLKIVKNRRAKKVFFVLILPYKTWWKPRFPMDQRPLVKGRILAYFSTFLSFCNLDDFSVFQINWVFGVLGPPSYGIGATIRIGREILCLPYAGFFS